MCTVATVHPLDTLRCGESTETYNSQLFPANRSSKMIYSNAFYVLSIKKWPGRKHLGYQDIISAEHKVPRFLTVKSQRFNDLQQSKPKQHDHLLRKVSRRLAEPRSPAIVQPLWNQPRGAPTRWTLDWRSSPNTPTFLTCSLCRPGHRSLWGSGFHSRSAAETFSCCLVSSPVLEPHSTCGLSC